MKVIVIGAGAGGLGAARALHDDGHDVTVLEARDRLGGRATTSYDVASHPVELGAEFIHGENVCTWDYVRRFGVGIVDIHDRIGLRVHDGQLHDESFLMQPNALLGWKMPSAAAAWIADGNADIALADAATRMPGFIDGDLQPSKRAFWNTLVSQFHCGSIDEVGVGGVAEATHDGDGNQLFFRLADGYTDLMSRVADGIDVRLSTPVERIEWSTGDVTVAANGERFEGDRAVITLPLAILQADDVAFSPELPPEKRAAIDGLGYGPAAKIVLRFSRPVWPEGMSFLITTNDSQNWWRSGAGRANEDNILTSLVCGPSVERLRARGDPVKEGLRLLEEALGTPLAHDVVDSRFVDWGTDPWSKMGYSHVPPGGVGLRDALAEPVGDVLHFAGEATSRIRPQTVHGAFESGHRAAAEISGGGHISARPRDSLE